MDLEICARCGNSDNSVNMILVEPTDGVEIWFCNWNCVGDYAISEEDKPS
jgi:hypothetical protein